jgi:hypothetical protein
MKQFLRYQISGMIFVLWLLIFYYSGDVNSFESFLSNLEKSNFFKNETLYGFIVALPIGVIIHQISVNIKNHIFVKLCEELNDMPNEEVIKLLDNEQTKFIEYILEKISNLNSFYYVRFDNGFLAPFLAFILVVISGHSINSIAVIMAIILGYIMLYYISRICKELKIYYSMIRNHIEYKSKSNRKSIEEVVVTRSTLFHSSPEVEQIGK